MDFKSKIYKNTLSKQLATIVFSIFLSSSLFAQSNIKKTRVLFFHYEYTSLSFALRYTKDSIPRPSKTTSAYERQLGEKISPEKGSKECARGRE